MNETGMPVAAPSPPRMAEPAGGGGSDEGLSKSHIRPSDRTKAHLQAMMQRQNYEMPGGKAIFWQGGSLVKVTREGSGRPEGSGGKRGKIKRFSKGSRWRCMQKMGMIRRDALPIFLTLTFPDQFPDDPREWKAFLKAWFKRLLRQHPDAAGVWKMEMQPRQSGENEGQIAPHFHLLLWGVPWEWEDEKSGQFRSEFVMCTQSEIRKDRRLWKKEREVEGVSSSHTEYSAREPRPGEVVQEYHSSKINRKGHKVTACQWWVVGDHPDNLAHVLNRHGIRANLGPVDLHQWVSLTWAEVVGSDDPRHLAAGTRCEVIRSREGAMWYTSKYIAKADELEAGEVGRWWGVFNKEKIPWGKCETKDITYPESIRLLRAARNYIKAGRRRPERIKSNPKTSGTKRRLPGRVKPNLQTWFCDASGWNARFAELTVDQNPRRQESPRESLLLLHQSLPFRQGSQASRRVDF